MNLIVTTILNPTPPAEDSAGELAVILGAPLVNRGGSSLDALRTEHGADIVLVATKTGPVVHTPGGEYFFHLNMAELRIKNLKDGKHDHMVTAMALAPGMSVLDCTLGLGSDAIVASFVAGEKGRVLGLEASPVIAAVTGSGMASFVSDQPDITAALRRISVVNADYNLYLENLPAASFDVVFFDPMFRAPVHSSASFRPLRHLADPSSLGPEAVAAARRVAARRVVMKEASGSREFARLGFTTTVGGKHSSVHYGVMETGR